jgi:hypothetical protein
MKKLSLISIFFLALFMPAGAQPADTETGPIETLTLKKGDIPPSILQTCEQIFRESTQVKWGNFPYQLKKYGWVTDTSFYGKPQYYEVFIKTKEAKNNSRKTLYYTKEGNQLVNK